MPKFRFAVQTCPERDLQLAAVRIPNGLDRNRPDVSDQGSKRFIFVSSLHVDWPIVVQFTFVVAQDSRLKGNYPIKGNTEHGDNQQQHSQRKIHVFHWR